MGRAKSPRNAAGARLSTSGGGRDCVGRPKLGEAATGGRSVRAAGESARAFLTVSTAHLTFCCSGADLDLRAILRTYGQGGRVARIVRDVEPDAFDVVVKKPLLAVPVRVHGEPARNTARNGGSAG